MLHFQKKSIYLFDCQCIHKHPQGGSWSWSYGSWIYNYLFNQCLSPLTLWVWTPLRRGVQHYMIKCVSDLQQVDGFLRVQVSSTNKTDCNDITEILLKVALNTITLTLFILDEIIAVKAKNTFADDTCKIVTWH